MLNCHCTQEQFIHQFIYKHFYLLNLFFHFSSVILENCGRLGELELIRCLKLGLCSIPYSNHEMTEEMAMQQEDNCGNTFTGIWALLLSSLNFSGISEYTMDIRKIKQMQLDVLLILFSWWGLHVATIDCLLEVSNLSDVF